MSRSRASARQAGSAFETQTCKTFSDAFPELEIHRSPRWGAKDKGDLTGVKTSRVTPVTITLTLLPVQARLAVECKNVHDLSLPSALKEARIEAENAGAEVGIVVHKRFGTTDPLKQIVSMEMGDFLRLLGRPQS
ncbi:hypothetical protein Wildcat_85 [Mycobacterium phage Wildcat]|uniref:Holliday junction resolvase n=4 Tax=Mycobacterium virus Wildcat TaxID=1993859 RepID=Q19XX5_9CAUD|nr:hypothetical protein Wildcat_85 [Mycobacterium phage Wildcat]AJD82157.1 hypothetical protein COSMO_85 [Mycobacterium phage Cosmo]AQT25755.1 holliday junction resolvase [Mycobacterium phage EniyanLRS]QGJ89972.1 holliday junction resolvase [Mycobacterium phage MaryV]WKR36095.1 hypothetical protein [Mycobacterium phage Azrael100]ABE67690.1 hypothetical protein Wildcat_85 [Mycobacterium phage Wildcat]